VAVHSDEISVNPMNIQRGTVIDRLHRHNEYRPPWLWSLVDMIQRAHPLIHPENGINGDPDQVSRLIVHPTAGGKIRGSHNCGSCDGEVVAAIERYAVSGSLLEFDGIECSCREVWEAEVNLERSLPVPLGLSKPRRGSVIQRLRSP
jgi:radical SAM enzyme (TIGR01210 family)